MHGMQTAVYASVFKVKRDIIYVKRERERVCVCVCVRARRSEREVNVLLALI